MLDSNPTELMNKNELNAPVKAVFEDEFISSEETKCDSIIKTGVTDLIPREKQGVTKQLKFNVNHWIKVFATSINVKKKNEIT